MDICLNWFPGYFEETEDCISVEDRFKTIPFKIKYLWSKNPCDKCLVKPACLDKYLTVGIKCELKKQFLREEKTRDRFYNFLVRPPVLSIIAWIVVMIFGMSTLIFIP